MPHVCQALCLVINIHHLHYPLELHGSTVRQALLFLLCRWDNWGLERVKWLLQGHQAWKWQVRFEPRFSWLQRQSPLMALPILYLQNMCGMFISLDFQSSTERQMTALEDRLGLRSGGWGITGIGHLGKENISGVSTYHRASHWKWKWLSLYLCLQSCQHSQYPSQESRGGKSKAGPSLCLLADGNRGPSCCRWSSAMIDGGPFVEPEAIIHGGQWPTGTQHIEEEHEADRSRIMCSKGKRNLLGVWFPEVWNQQEWSFSCMRVIRKCI